MLVKESPWYLINLSRYSSSKLVLYFRLLSFFAILWRTLLNKDQRDSKDKTIVKKSKLTTIELHLLCKNPTRTQWMALVRSWALIGILSLRLFWTLATVRDLIAFLMYVLFQIDLMKIYIYHLVGHKSSRNW